jgi:hypothetical protein
VAKARASGVFHPKIIVQIGKDRGRLNALAGADRPPKGAGSAYLVAKARASGVFHPKIIVQIGKDRGRLIVASANATAAGLAGNLEIAAVVDCGSQASGERRLVLAGWKYALAEFSVGRGGVGAAPRQGWNDGHGRQVRPQAQADGGRGAILVPPRPRATETCVGALPVASSGGGWSGGHVNHPCATGDATGGLIHRRRAGRGLPTVDQLALA